MQVHFTTVQRLQAKYHRTRSVADRPKQPRGRVTTRQQDQHIGNVHNRNRRAVASVTARTIIGTHGRPISARTVRNRLREAGLRCRRPYYGIVLTPRHRQRRLEWVRRNIRKTRAEWAAVLFTDESRFNLFERDGRQRVYRRRNERYRDNCVIESNRQGGGSVMIWGGVSFNTKTQCVQIRGNLNAARYRDEILNPVCIPHLRNNRRMTLMHDGAPAHTARVTQALLRASRINILPWPSCSPDLNPIEHIWDVIGRNVRARESRNIRELERAVLDEWNRVQQHVCREYVLSMRSRCRAVINASCGHTRY